MFFLNLPDLQKPGRNRLPRKSCWVIKALGVLDQIISYIQFYQDLHRPLLREEGDGAPAVPESSSTANDITSM